MYYAIIAIKKEINSLENQKEIIKSMVESGLCEKDIYESICKNLDYQMMGLKQGLDILDKSRSEEQ